MATLLPFIAVRRGSQPAGKRSMRHAACGERRSHAQRATTKCVRMHQVRILVALSSSVRQSFATDAG
jgi:hypothetical protein